MRLIDADAMIDGWIDGVNEPIYSANDVIDDIDEQPTVAAVDVVRCKDCVWNKQPQCPLSYTSPISEDGEVSIWYKNKGNDYCSYGKRKAVQNE